MAHFLTKEKRLLIFNKYNGKCAYCGIDLDFNLFHVDHIIPKRRGDTQDYLNKYSKGIIKGKDNLDNLNPSCCSCNSSKSTFTLDQWRNEINLKYNRLIRYDSTFKLLVRFKIIKKNEKEILFYFETL